MINKKHPNYKKLSKMQKINIKYLHQLREQSLLEMAKISLKDTTKLKWYEERLLDIELNLQSLWGFKQNKDYFKFWLLPHCSCPKMDNEDSYPSGYYYLSGNCPLHSKHFTLELNT